MLKELLIMLSGDSIMSEAELAAKLGVSIEALRGMLEQLVNLGFLEKTDAASMETARSSTARGGTVARTGAGPAEGKRASASDRTCASSSGCCAESASLLGLGGCSACPMHGSCHKKLGAAYSLTAKGKAAALESR